MLKFISVDTNIQTCDVDCRSAIINIHTLYMTSDVQWFLMNLWDWRQGGSLSRPWGLAVLFQQWIGNSQLKVISWRETGQRYIEGILPKGPYLPCVSMASRALLAGYHRYVMTVSSSDQQSFKNQVGIGFRRPKGPLLVTWINFNPCIDK